MSKEVERSHTYEFIGFFNELVDEEVNVVDMVVFGDVVAPSVCTYGGQIMGNILNSKQIVVCSMISLSGWG